MDGVLPPELRLETDRQLVAGCVEALLSTILFHRLFGPLTPEAVEVVGVTYPLAGSQDAANVVKKKSKQLNQVLSESNAACVRLTFGERQPKNNLWFGKHHDTPWEEWVIDVKVDRGSSLDVTSSVQKQTTQKLKQLIMIILDYMDAQKTNIPPITTTEVDPFPFEISISSS